MPDSTAKPTNENCLLNRCCPECKQDQELLLYTARWTCVSDDGTDDDAPSLAEMDRGLAFADDDSAKCPRCPWFGKWWKTQIFPEEIEYERICRLAGLEPTNKRDPLNRMLSAALNSDDPSNVLDDDLNVLRRMVAALDNPPASADVAP